MVLLTHEIILLSRILNYNQRTDQWSLTAHLSAECILKHEFEGHDRMPHGPFICLVEGYTKIFVRDPRFLPPVHPRGAPHEIWIQLAQWFQKMLEKVDRQQNLFIL